MVSYFKFFLLPVGLIKPISTQEIAHHNFSQILNRTNQLYEAVRILRDDFNQPKDLHVVPYATQVIAGLKHYYQQEKAIDNSIRKFFSQDNQLPSEICKQFIEEYYHILQNLNSQIRELCDNLLQFYFHQEVHTNNSLRSIGSPQVKEWIETNSAIFNQIRSAFKNFQKYAEKEDQLLNLHKHNALHYVKSLTLEHRCKP